MKQRIRIVAYDAITAAGHGVEPLWQALERAQPGQARHDLGDSRLPEATYVAIPERPEPEGDLATAWLRRVVEGALARADDQVGAIDNPRTALIGGSSLGGMTLFERQHRQAWDSAGKCGPGVPVNAAQFKRARYDGPVGSVGADYSAGAWSINTACSSAANALGIARTWLLRGRIDIAVVAGFDVISPFVYAGFRCLGAVDPEPTTPFASERRGLNLGEAAVAFVLMRDDDVRSDDGIDLVGYGSSCDAHHLTRPDLSGAGLARAISYALDDAGLAAGDVAAISAHGTGTAFNDRMETAAFATLFPAPYPPMHAGKPVFGHTLGAAGAVDAITIAEALRRGRLPPSYRRGDADPELPLHPSTVAHQLPADAVALSTSSGFGGSNAALLLQRPAGDRSEP